MAQAPIPIYSRNEPFYVPRFKVSVRGKPLNAGVVNDILQLTYKDSLNEIDSFQIEINNWDAGSRSFKYAPPLKNSSVNYTGMFDPGSQIEIWMGYGENLRRMLRGEITSLSPNYPESGASTLSVGGLNELHKYRTEQHTYSWLDGNKTDTDIAKDLCGRPVKKGQPGLGLKIDAHPAQGEKPDPVVFMNNEYDIVFLVERARHRGYEIYLEDETSTPTLFFGVSQNAAQAPVYRLEWGKSLISFKPTLSTAKQIAQVNVRGWDRKANKAIDETYKLEDLWKEQKKSQQEIARLKLIAQAYGNKTDVITDKPVHTKKEARDLAKAILTNQSNKLIEASGSTVGLPDLRCGSSLEIVGFGVSSNRDERTTGVSSDFDGEYFVTGSTHTIGASGYRTEFSARRDGPANVEIPPQQNS